VNQQRISMITATRPAPATGDLQPAQPRPKLAMSVVAWTRRTAVWMGLLLASTAVPGHGQATARPRAGNGPATGRQRPLPTTRRRRAGRPTTGTARQYPPVARQPIRRPATGPPTPIWPPIFAKRTGCARRAPPPANSRVSNSGSCCANSSRPPRGRFPGRDPTESLWLQALSPARDGRSRIEHTRARSAEARPGVYRTCDARNAQDVHFLTNREAPA